MTIKTKEQLEKINTKNLLALYKAERGRNFSFIANNTCGCCGELMANLYENSKTYQSDFTEFRNEQKQRTEYLALIKSVLNTREHVEQQITTKKNGNTNKVNKRRIKKN